MPMRDAYQERVNAHIEELYQSLDHHEEHLESTESVSMDSHLEALRQLKEKRRHLNGLLKELEAAGEHGWQHLRNGIDTAIDEFRHAIDAARAKLRGEK